MSNRGNGRAAVFDKPGECDAFVSRIEGAPERIDARAPGDCLTPDPFHRIVHPRCNAEPSRGRASVGRSFPPCEQPGVRRVVRARDILGGHRTKPRG